MRMTSLPSSPSFGGHPEKRKAFESEPAAAFGSTCQYWSPRREPSRLLCWAHAASAAEDPRPVAPMALLRVPRSMGSVPDSADSPTYAALWSLSVWDEAQNVHQTKPAPAYQMHIPFPGPRWTRFRNISVPPFPGPAPREKGGVGPAGVHLTAKDEELFSQTSARHRLLSWGRFEAV